MEQYISKSALVAEINKLYNGEIDTYTRDILGRLKFKINTLEVKEVDLEKEIDNKWNTDYEDFGIPCDDFYDIAKHFFELGLKAQHSSIGIPNIDDIFEEEGIDPNSKDAKIFKESYYMALEKLKAQKGGV
jgi:hypothetical protein